MVQRDYREAVVTRAHLFQSVCKGVWVEDIC